MKNLQKMVALALALMMVFSMSAMVFADAPYTITIGDAVNGETYTAYKLMDATYEGDDVGEDTPIAYYYTGASTDALYGILDDYFQFDAFRDGKAYLKVVDASGNPIDYSGVDVAALAKAINDAMNAETPLVLTEAGHATAADDTATIDVNDKGYYFVNTSLGSVCSIDTASNVTINEKNTETTQDKTVEEDSTEEFGDKNDASIGDTVNFKTTVTIGKYQKNVVFHDIMQTTKLAIDWSSIAVEGADGKHTILTASSDSSHGNFPTGDTASLYTGDTFAVQFDNDWTSGLTADITVTITYSATLTADAVIGEDSSEMDAGNDNKSSVTYGDAQRTTWDWTRTYTWSFDILKYTGTDTPLDGAEFELKQGNTTLKFDLVSTGAAATATVYRYNPSGSVTTLVTPASGLIEIQGLDADTYTLTETKEPTGYNKLTSDITVEVDSNTDTDQGTDGTSQPNGSVTIKQDSEEVNQVSVLNNSGTELPSTGGVGTTIFYILGAVLVVGAGVLMVTRRRMNAD